MVRSVHGKLSEKEMVPFTPFPFLSLKFPLIQTRCNRLWTCEVKQFRSIFQLSARGTYHNGAISLSSFPVLVKCFCIFSGLSSVQGHVLFCQWKGPSSWHVFLSFPINTETYNESKEDYAKPSQWGRLCSCLCRGCDGIHINKSSSFFELTRFSRMNASELITRRGRA